MRTLIGAIGRKTLANLEHLGAFYMLMKNALYWTVVAPFQGRGLRWKNSVYHMVIMGFNSIVIVGLIALFVGIIMALQSAYQLVKFGADLYVADIVSVSVTRELGPLLTAIIIAGRSGSAIAAEIGTMKVSEEIDALETMGLNPIKFLVVPKLLALLIMLPTLTIFADWIGILGGLIVGFFVLDIGAANFMREAFLALVMRDIITGLVKSIVFASIIVGVGCYEGFRVTGGAEGVGKSTTASVVASIFLIIVADVIFTAIFYYI